MNPAAAPAGITKASSPLARWIRLWLVLAFSYLLLKFVYNLLWLRWIDLNFRDYLVEALSVSLGQSVVLWLVTRRARRPRSP
jgi:hypothetical protein